MSPGIANNPCGAKSPQVENYWATFYLILEKRRLDCHPVVSIMAEAVNERRGEMSKVLI